MFPSPTTASDLAELELRLGREEKDLQVLKDSLETTDALSRQMISILDGFDGRLSKLDARVMPISRNMQVFSQIYNSNISLDNMIIKSEISQVHWEWYKCCKASTNWH